MFCYTPLTLSHSYWIKLFSTPITKTQYLPPWKNTSDASLSHHSRISCFPNLFLQPPTVSFDEEEKERPKLRWVEVGPDITEAQKQAISQLPLKMTKRCKALMKRLICFISQEEDLSLLLGAWVKIMKPRRADWLVVLKEMTRLENPLLLEVTEYALVEESFEANIRDYTKLIDAYAKQNRLQDAEKTLAAMKGRGFTCDQVTLTALVHMYSKAGNLTRAQETFEEMKLLGLPLDKRAYGSMIMAYIRAGMAERGEHLMREMEAQDICARKEVYKALLRAYSMAGDSGGAQRVFDAIQFAGIVPDVKHCALLMTAYCEAGQSDQARSVLENFRSAGLRPSDKCVALMLATYEKENNLEKALALLLDLEKDGVVVGQEASEVLAKWFSRLGVINEVEHVLREYGEKEVKCRLRTF
ncbi:tetratricopeptide repeat (TPR)-like superfamily protein [Tasmannia lanceolata]|uniref:tetratricopeptide repeat (TPR)-like superfamily protein n=1 Tax=Tasmannia lanceolata TaxID=3420 RepID=UPI004063BFFC